MKKIFLSCILFGSFISVSHAGYDVTYQYHHAEIQKYALSCEYSALSAVLTHMKGYLVTEDELIKRVPTSWSGVSAVWQDGKRVWGDPEVGFVGGIGAHQYDYSGYGVYEKPLASVVASYGLSGTVINQSQYEKLGLTPWKHLLSVLDALEQGKAVILWGDICTDPQYDDGKVSMHAFTREQYHSGLNGKNNCGSWGVDRTMTWYAWRGDELVKIQGLSGDHVFVLLGYVGKKENPTHVRVFDTYTGFHTYPVNEWLRKWGMMQYRSLIVSDPGMNDLVSGKTVGIDETFPNIPVEIRQSPVMSGNVTTTGADRASGSGEFLDLRPIVPKILE